MEEKRKYKRLEIDVSVQLERLDQDEITTLKYVHVDVKNLSRGGMGFDSSHELEPGTYYNVRIRIWTNEIIEAVIEIVRKKEGENKYQYGATFIGLSEADALKIDIYQMFNEL